MGEDEGALDGEPLRLVAGERVGMADVPGVEVAGGERQPALVVELDHDRPLRTINRQHGAAAAVRDRETAVVAGAEDTVARGELEPAVQAQPLGAEPPLALEEGARDPVQLGDVRSPVGDHHAPDEIGRRGAPPVGDQLRLHLRAAVADDEPSLLGAVSKVVPACALAEKGKGAAFQLVALAAAVVELDRPVALSEGGEQPARADGGELGRVADEHRLPVGVVDLEEQAGERARICHPRLVDHEHASAREASALSCFGEQPVQGAARDSRPGLEVGGCHP
jgi:hypothetical protein